MSPTMLQDKEDYQRTHARNSEPDVTVHDDIDDSAFSQPSHDEIAVLAYSYWVDSGQQDGSADEHWLRAERELRARRSAAASDSGAGAASRTESSGAPPADSARRSGATTMARPSQTSRSDSSQR